MLKFVSRSQLHCYSLIKQSTMTFYSNSELVNSLKEKRIIKTDRVEQVMSSVDRLKYRGEYFDSPLGIGHGQTISAPHMHAMCLEILSPVIKEGSHVLDVGSGSGYLTACFGKMVGDSGKVIGVETIPQLVKQSLESLNNDCPELLNTSRIEIKHANGWLGDPENAPYDAIHVGAAAVEIPEALTAQLKQGGILVIPVGPQDGSQNLIKIEKLPDGSLTSKNVCGVRYVPLVNHKVEN